MGFITASSVPLKPSTILRKSPWCLLASARADSFPSTAAPASALPSSTTAATAPMQRLTLCLIWSKSPSYVSLTCSGISPREMSSMFSEAIRMGFPNASMVLFMPSTRPLNCTCTDWVSARVSSLPARTAPASFSVSTRRALMTAPMEPESTKPSNRSRIAMVTLETASVTTTVRSVCSASMARSAASSPVCAIDFLSASATGISEAKTPA